MRGCATGCIYCNTLLTDQVGEVFNLSKSSVHRALAAAGFKRCNAALKPELTPELQAERLTFGRKFEHLTEEEWLAMPILWTDETWATYGNHKMAQVTRRPSERLHPDCVQHRYQRPQGWMFWGSTFGTRKGPGFVWEKEWGNITAANYQVCGKSFRTFIRLCLEVAKDADTSQQHTLPTFWGSSRPRPKPGVWFTSSRIMPQRIRPKLRKSSCVVMAFRLSSGPPGLQISILSSTAGTG